MHRVHCPDQEALRTGNEALRAGREALRTDREALRTSREALRTSKEALHTGKEELRASKEVFWTKSLQCLLDEISPERSSSFGVGWYCSQMRL